MACGILVPVPGIKFVCPLQEVQNLSLSLSLFLLLKLLLFPFGSRKLGRGLRVFKKLPPVGCRGKGGEKALTLVGPSTHWAPEKLLVVLEGEPFEEIAQQPRD